MKCAANLLRLRMISRETGFGITAPVFSISFIATAVWELQILFTPSTRLVVWIMRHKIISEITMVFAYDQTITKVTKVYCANCHFIYGVGQISDNEAVTWINQIKECWGSYKLQCSGYEMSTLDIPEV